MLVEKDGLYLVFQGTGVKLRLLISCRPEVARICEVADLPELETERSSFAEYMRAHVVGSVFAGILGAAKSRQIELLLQSRADHFTILLSLLGSRSNIYLLDADRRIIHSVRLLEKTREELKIGDTWSDPKGEVKDEGIDRWEGVSDELFLAAIQETYAGIERAREVETLSRKLQVAIRREQLFLERKATNLIEDMADAREADNYRKKGELLKGILHTIKPGMESVAAIDYETGEKVEITLDSKLSPAENLESYFAKYQKESRGIAAIQEQMDLLEKSRAELNALGETLAAILNSVDPDPASLRDLLSQGPARRLMNRFYPAPKQPRVSKGPSKKSQIPARLAPKRYETEDGLEIWVGRTDEGNDYLTTRLARGNDLFFHLEGYPGSHVILRTGGKADPPPRSVLDAAELAVHFSKLKDQPTADVHVAAVKDVKKPKGAKPGLVFVRRGKTIHLRRNPARLREILSCRLND